ncbi:MAG: thiol:disulfide interchange protein DsbA/DsbL [Pseudomonadota bacterium]
MSQSRQNTAALARSARRLLVGLLSAAALVALLPARAADYEAGVHYEELLLPVAVTDPSRVEVVEMFSYMCVHCFNFDATVHQWSKSQPDDVVFRQVPAIFNKSWEAVAQGFYTAQLLGVGEQVHGPIFEAIHVKNQDVRSASAMAALFKQHAGVSTEDFNKAYKSFSVRSKVQQAARLVAQYRLGSVPSMIVNGKYRVEVRMAGGNTGMLRVVEHLVEKERAALAAAAAQPAAGE